jgi:hypothetical protein
MPAADPLVERLFSEQPPGFYNCAYNGNNVAFL